MSSASWPEHAREIANAIQRLQDAHIYPLANAWKSSHPDWFDNNDVRVHWFIGAARMLNNFKLSYIAIGAMGDIRSWRNILGHNQQPKIAESDISDWLREYETFVTWAYVIGVSAITEEAIRLVSKALNGREVGEFKNIYEHLLKIVGLQTLGPLFDLFRLIRNTVHNNGVYLPNSLKDETVQWKGNTYTFVVGAGVSFITTRFLVETLTLDLAKAMDHIMKAQAICALNQVTRRVSTGST